MTKAVQVDGIPIEYTDTGSGSPIVFVHGVYVTGALWDDVVTRLSSRYRCIAPTWPFGAQSAPVGDVDLSVPATVRRIGAFLQALDLNDVTLVANDTGGGIVLSALGSPPTGFDRVSRLVFTNCDSYEHFPPGSFKPLVKLCAVNRRLGALALRGLAGGAGQRFFIDSTTRNGLAPDRYPAIFGGFATSGAVRAEAARFTAGLHPRFTLAAAPAITSWPNPVLLVWGDSDRLFPLAHAQRLADAFPNATLEVVPNSSTYVMLDDPDRAAAAIERFLG